MLRYVYFVCVILARRPAQEMSNALAWSALQPRLDPVLFTILARLLAQGSRAIAATFLTRVWSNQIDGGPISRQRGLDSADTIVDVSNLKKVVRQHMQDRLPHAR